MVVSAILPNSATISFTTSDSAEGSVQYRIGTQAALSASGEGDSTMHSIALSSLLPGQTYSFQAIATDSSGTTDSEVKTFQTPMFTISDLSVSVTSNTSATVSFGTNALSHGMIYYGTTSAFGQSSAATKDEGAHSITLTGLSPGQTYYYQAAAIQYSSQTFTVTKNGSFAVPSVFPAIGSLSVSPAASSATISFSTNIMTHGSVNYGTTALLGQSSAVTADTVAHSIALTGLSTGKTYYYQAVAAVYTSSGNYQITEGGSFETSGGTSSPSPTPKASTLRQLANQRGFYIGSALDPSNISPSPSPTPSLVTSNLNLVTSQYNILTPQTELKWPNIEPHAPKFNSSGVLVPAANPSSDFNFAPVDALFQYASANQFTIHGHVFLYAITEPAWLTGCTGTEAKSACAIPWTQDQLKQILKYHVQSIVSHYRQNFPNVPVLWDLVNETNYGESEYTPGYTGGSIERTSVFEQIVDPVTGLPSTTYYIALASQYAKEIDNNIRFCINDAFEEDGDGFQARAMYQFIPALQAQIQTLGGAPIYCVGFESHFLLASYNGSGSNPTKDTLAMAIQRFATLGLKVLLSELDVAVPLVGAGAIPPISGPGPTFSTISSTAPYYWPAQAQVYSDMLSACLEASNCIGVITWMYNDLDSYYSLNNAYGLARYGLPEGYSSDPLPFDLHNSPKPAYTAMFNALQTAVSSAQMFSAQEAASSAGGAVLAASSVNAGDYEIAPSSSSMSFPVSAPSSVPFDIHFKALAGIPAASGTWPSLTVKLDGTTLATVSVNSPYLSDYEVSAFVASGNRTLTLTPAGGSTDIYLNLVWLQPSTTFSFYKTGLDLYADSSGATITQGSALERASLTGPGSYLRTSVGIPQTGTYEIVISGNASNVGGVFAVLVDGTVAATFTGNDNLGTKGVDFLQDYRFLANLSRGNHTVQILSQVATKYLYINIDHLYISSAPTGALEMRTRGMLAIPGPSPSPTSAEVGFSTENTSTSMIGFIDVFPVSAAGLYQIEVTAASHQIINTAGVSQAPWGEAEVIVDGTTVGTATIVYDDWITLPVGGAIKLTEGSHSIRVEMENPGALDASFVNSRDMAIQSVKIAPVQ